MKDLVLLTTGERVAIGAECRFSSAFCVSEVSRPDRAAVSMIRRSTCCIATAETRGQPTSGRDTWCGVL
jgi:hypothetical protein